MTYSQRLRQTPRAHGSSPYDKACKSVVDNIKDVKGMLAQQAAAAQQGEVQTVELTTAAEKVSASRAKTLKRARDSLQEESQAQKGIRLRRQESLE